MAACPMRCAPSRFAAPGGPEALTPTKRPRPSPRAGEILIRVAAAGVNRPDVLQRQGFYAPPPGASDLPGLEIAGEVVALGEGASRFKLGDAATALVAGGGYAEYCVVHETNALPVPAGLSLIEAAAIPETYCTVWTNVFDRGGLKRGECAARPRRDVGHRHDGDPARQGVRGARVDDRRLDRQGESLRAARRRSGDRLSRTRTSSSRRSPRPAARAPTSSSTWSAATMSRATTPPRRSTAASSRSPSCAGARSSSTCTRSWPSGSSTPARRCGRARSPRRRRSSTSLQAQRLAAARRTAAASPLIDSTFPLAEAAAAHRRIENADHVGKIVLTL